MKVKAITIFFLLSSICLLAKAKTARLYNLTTAEVVIINYSGRGHGKLDAVNRDGEHFKGEFVTIVGGNVAWGSIYASVYGSGGSANGSANSASYSVSTKNRGSAIMTGDKSTIIDCEYVSGIKGGSGACKDNHGILYKLMF